MALLSFKYLYKIRSGKARLPSEGRKLSSGPFREISQQITKFGAADGVVQLPPALLLLGPTGCGILFLCWGRVKLLKDMVPQDLFRRRPLHWTGIHHGLKMSRNKCLGVFTTFLACCTKYAACQSSLRPHKQNHLKA
jgi:hypothetical protein